jgi:hypothetical protein
MGGREAVVLTPQGEFKKVPVPKGTWEIGDEINFAETQQQPIWAKWGLAAAAAAILLLAPLGYAGFQQYQLSLPAAIVTLDINPSLELTLNKVDDVLSARGLNADGQALLQHINTKGRPALDEVVEAATEAAVDLNKLDPADPTGAVLLAVAPTGDKTLPVDKAETIREKAKQAAADAVSQAAKKKGAEPKATVAGVVVTPAEKKAAETAGVSPGKYTFFEELQQVAPGVRLEDVKNTGPGKLLKNLNISPGDFFSQAEANHGADDQNKPKSERKSEDKTEQQAVPTGGKADDKQPGNGKTDNPGKGDDKQDQKPEDKGNAPAEPKKDDKQQEHKQGNGAQSQENKGSAGAKDEKKGESGSKGEPKKQESPSQKENGNEKKSSWTIPFLGITIEKPAFLQGKDDTPAAPAVATPRADEPGAGAPSDKQADQKQSDLKQSDQKGSDVKQSDQKQSDQKQSDQKQSDQKQSDQKQSEKGSSKDQDKNNGKDQGNKDSGKSQGKDKGD